MRTNCGDYALKASVSEGSLALKEIEIKLHGTSVGVAVAGGSLGRRAHQGVKWLIWVL